jgi:hypothetical protein
MHWQGEVERLYRILMKSDPTDASASFNLGNPLRVSARNVEAEAALRAATCVDAVRRENPTVSLFKPNRASSWSPRCADSVR